MIELILGGARSGKSRLAEQLAQAKGKTLYYLATAQAGDKEMAERIEHHQERRGDDWQLIEEPLHLGQVLKQMQSEDRCILVDCLTLWMTNLLLHQNGQDLEAEKQSLLNSLTEFHGDVIFVSNEVGQGIVPLGELNRRFVDESGWLHQDIAQLSDRVIFTVAGIPQVLKGDPLCKHG